ncbi:Transcriptional regulator, AraC family [Marinobacter nitratireducens]|uniref:Transcriptional regulator, AraC family n=1 Tax=Marinobacter nitratireducens TaxID=1137280 RepID=A0A072N5U1_9GAMM|nr:AraC family transcriptional regulator [Marinobacter nitratireducens]KEF32886.1 Transcriptional regulator, AraC family [Marinobacter nitratireducens]TNE97934.1 MAG: AraC family transcriptional regulator [Gammaproteobacteria bacterium]
MPSSRKTGSANTLGDISVLYVAVLLRAAEAEGANIADLMDRFNLSEQTLSSPAARISLPRLMRLGHAAIQLTGNRALGLRMGAMTRPVDVGIAGLAGASAPTVAQGFDTLVRYALLGSQSIRGNASIDHRNRSVNFYSIRPYNDFNYFVVDSVLAAWAQFARHLTGRNEVLEEVSIEYPSTGLDDLFEGWFRCPVRFGAKQNQVVICPEAWSLPSGQAQAAMHSKLRDMCEAELQQIKRGWSTGDQVKNLLTPLFQGETPSLKTIADKLGLSPWTLQRSLSREGTTFRELMDDTRKLLARDYIRETGSSLTEIAWLLGFANPAAFHKAYRRWFDISPGEHRKVFNSDKERH